MNVIEQSLSGRDFLVVDGALATELERRGAGLDDALWSARLLRDDPDLIGQVHRDYLEAGADVVITASYQATLSGFVRAGADRAVARDLLTSSVSLARSVRDAYCDERRPTLRPLVAVSVGPYGAALADGSEYRGDYDLDVPALADFHRERLAALVDAGGDLVACETIPSLTEAEALLGLLDEHPGVTAWMSFSARDGHRISDGTLLSECVERVNDHGAVAAVGINCTSTEHIATLVQDAAAHTDLPVVVYPNSGEHWDDATRTWHGVAATGTWAALAGRWRDAGARLIGGCCRTTPAEIAEIATAVR